MYAPAGLTVGKPAYGTDIFSGSLPIQQSTILHASFDLCPEGLFTFTHQGDQGHWPGQNNTWYTFKPMPGP